MRNVRNALIAVCVLGGVAAIAAAPGIEVLRVSGIEVLAVETHSTDFPVGALVWAVMDLPTGPVVVGVAPVNPLTGNATVIFPVNHPSNRVELRTATGVLLDYEPVIQFD